jgi:hypothetical protein
MLIFHTHKIIQDNQGYECPICVSEGNPKDYVVHSGIGSLHPAHKECLIPWILKHNSCPSCRMPVDPSSLLSLKSRVIREIKNLAVDALTDDVAGILLNRPRGGVLGANISNIVGLFIRVHFSAFAIIFALVKLCNRPVRSS